MIEDAMDKVMNKIIGSQNKELFSKTQEELESYWFYPFDNNNNDDEILYFNFYEALKHYEYKCATWEEYHNGTDGLVERVRDKYILPKIRLFLEKQKGK